jgi:hypothetical protein
MLFRMFPLAVLALAPFIGGPALFADEYTLDGKLVSTADNKLTVTCKDGTEQVFALAADVKVKCDGRTCTYEDLKPGMKVRIAARLQDKQVAIRIEALDKLSAFDGAHDGKLVSINENKLVMTGKNGKEHSHMLSPQAKLILDGQPCKWDELKPGTRIRVTTRSQESQLVVRIEVKLVMTNKAGKEQSVNLSPHIEVTCDGQTCKVDDLKSGMRIRISTITDPNQLAIRIEALDKQEAFDILN